MNCLLNPLTGRSSQLHEELYKFYGNNQEQADRTYNLVNTEVFINFFGDWTKLKKTDEEEKLLSTRTNEHGEPRLFTNKLGAKYFLLQDGKRYFINRDLLNYNYKQRKALISSSLIYLLGNNITESSDIDNIDFSDLYKEENSEGITNDAYRILGGNRESLKELESAIKSYTGNLSYRVDEREEFIEDGILVDVAESDRVLDLRSSEEKNSKDNATANIKFLLSYIPKFDSNGDLATEELTTPNGEVIEIPTFYDYNEVWNMFEETLSGMYPQVNNGYVADLFDNMRAKMHARFGTNPSITFLTDPNEGLLVNLLDWKKNQFVQAFLKNKVAFYTTKIDDVRGKLKMSFFNSGDVTSRRKKVREEFIDGIQYRSGIFNTRTGERNIEVAKKINQSLNDKLSALIKKGSQTTVTEAGVILQNTFDELGISVNDEAVRKFIESFDNEEEHIQATKAVQKIQYLTGKLAKADNNFFDKKNNKLDRRAIQEDSLNTLAEFEKDFRQDVAENTVLGADNKKYWTFSLPNYLNVKLDEYKNNLQEKSKLKGFYQNSQLLQQFRANPDALDGFNILTFLNLRKGEGDVGVDNKTISQTDQFIDMLNKAVLINRKVERGDAKEDYSIYNTLAPADKGKMQSLQSSFFVDTNTTIEDLNEDSQAFSTEQQFRFSPQTMEVYRGYFKDEVYRIREAYELLKKYNREDLSEGERDRLKEQLYQNYHYKKGNLTTEVKQGIFKGRKIPLGNAFKFQLFDSLNVDLTSDNVEDIKATEKRLGEDKMRKIFTTADEGQLLEVRGEIFDLINEGELDELISDNLNKMLDKNLRSLNAKGIIEITTDENKVNKFTGNDSIIRINANKIVDEKIFKTYRELSENDSDAYLKFLSDSMINQHIHNIEYTKLFTGDYAYYKSFDDFSKRIPATYIDGVMPNLKVGDNPNYTMAVIPEVVVDSKLYKNIDANDAQGYITLDRWKFLMERLNKWNPKYEEAYSRMVKGTSTAEDHKLTAQPLKGVYFNLENGVPTYVKYSQAVLVPEAIKGTNLDNLRKAMEDPKNNIDEAVALSGVKVGGVTVSEVLDDNQQFKPDAEMKFYKQTLQNKAWRLQQDLSPKGIKPTLIGSQLKKNIIQNIKPEQTYGGRTGKDLVETIDNIYSELSNYYKDRLKEELGIGEDGEITNKDKFYELLLEEAKRDANINMVEALTNEYDMNSIVNNSRFQPLIASMINSRTIRIKSNGASYIQMSAHGWNITDAENAGVTMLVDTTELKPPRKEGNKVLPGQVFVTHNQIVKYIPNYRELAAEGKLKDKIDDKLRYIVGYRIPNQDLSSSDALEIVGIIPSMGDTMVPYIDITKKNGSDFDIDKMYAMLPEMKPRYTDNSYTQLRKYVDGLGLDKSEMIAELEAQAGVRYGTGYLNTLSKKELTTEFIDEVVTAYNSVYAEDLDKFREDNPIQIAKLEYITENNSKDTAKILNNQLIENYIHILTSPEKFKDLTSALDDNTLKNEIEELHGKGEVESGFDFFNPTYQLQKKFDNAAGKTGVGIGSNHLVDQTYTQILNFHADVNIGIGTTKTINTSEGNIEVTSFDNIMDINNEHQISKVLSWFLTAYVDIAKDPYITRGNHNTVTANLTFMLIRAGVPLTWVNNYVGQPVLKRYADLELNKESRFISSKATRGLIFDELETAIKEKYPQYQNEKAWAEFKENNETVSLKQDSLFKVNAKNLNKALKDNDPIQQYKIFQSFLQLKPVADQFGSTVSNTKQDVNGAPSSIAKLYLRDARKENLMYGDNTKFSTFANKFTMYLGTAERNSVDLVRNIYNRNFLSAFNNTLLREFAYKYRSDAKAEQKLSNVESMMYTYNVGRNKFFNLKNEEIDELLGENGMQSQVEAAKAKYPENIFLNSLIPNTEIEGTKKLYFVDMENISNKPTTYKNDLIKAWDDLFSQDLELAENLVKYSYISSGFKFGMNSFYEYIPASKYNYYVEPAFTGLEKVINKEEFENFLYRHNPELSPITEFNTGGKKKVGNLNLIVGKNLVAMQLGEDDNMNPPAYVHTEDDRGNVNYLYKKLGYDRNSNQEFYIMTRILGKKVGNRKIIEPSIPKSSIFTENNKLVTSSLTKAKVAKMEDVMNEHALQVSYKTRPVKNFKTPTMKINEAYEDIHEEFKCKIK